jgi:hypothetical protein
MGRTIQDRQLDVLAKCEAAQSAFKRREIAADIARDQYGSDDVEIADDPTVDYVDGGYWIPARLWVSADAVEDQFSG